jgi:DNA polymerase-3 subunit delta'
MSVFDDLVGQQHVVAVLRDAATAAAEVVAGGAGEGMTHAWLLTGPPGSGRSTAARAFAAALLCTSGGCGTCSACRTALAGTSADVTVVATTMLSIGVRAARDLVAGAGRRPVGGRWSVVVVEDADRLTEQAANALLKALEEPTPRTVWVLCAPALEDALPTIRSRCRHVGLRIPPTAAVAEVLERRDGIDPAMAAFAARVSQGHIGRARRLATDEQARLRRHAALRLPEALRGVGDALAGAAALVEAAADEASATSAVLDEMETEELSRALGAGTVGRAMPAGSAAQLSDLAKLQKTRAKRGQRDALDRALTDLASYYRDVLVVQLGAPVTLVNEELRPSLEACARAGAPEQTLRRIDAILACRVAMDGNVAPLLAVEAMALALRSG